MHSVMLDYLPSEFSEVDDWSDTALVALDKAAMSIGAGAMDPGVKLGSSSGFFIPGPFHGLPGSNSGIPKVSRPLDSTLVMPDEDLDDSGHPPPPPPGAVQGLSSNPRPLEINDT